MEFLITLLLLSVVLEVPGTSEKAEPRQVKDKADMIRTEMNHMDEVMLETNDKATSTDVRLVQEKVITVYGDVVLSDSERKFLNVYYKCRERQKLRKVKLETEISRLQ